MGRGGKVTSVIFFFTEIDVVFFQCLEVGQSKLNRVGRCLQETAMIENHESDLNIVPNEC